MKKAQLEDVFEWEGELVQVKWINEGHRAIGFVPVNAQPYPCCGHTKRWEIIEKSPLFKQGAQPIKTIKK